MSTHLGRTKPLVGALLPLPQQAVSPSAPWLNLRTAGAGESQFATSVAERGRPLVLPDIAKRRLKKALSNCSMPQEPVFQGLRVEQRTEIPKAGYRLRVSDAGVAIQAGSPQGVFYAATTLAQWIELHQPDSTATRPVAAIAPLEVEDQPTIRRRGLLLDISRNRVPTLPFLFSLIERLAELKLDQLQLYMEHTFAYQEHAQVWDQASPLTPEQVRQVVAFASEHFIEVVPNQNSFGHLHRWLRWPAYRHLAECPEGVKHPFGSDIEPFSLCATDPLALEFLEGLYEELLPNFSSALLNVGLDETFDLGQGRSREACEQKGQKTVYLEFLKQVHQLAAKQGRRIQFWGDIVLEEPERISEVPQDSIGLIWGYEASHPFEEQAQAFAHAGLSFYLCPGTSSWNSFGGRTDNASRNIEVAARAAELHGAEGLLLTDWGDFGHLQPPSVSFLPLAMAADRAWNPSGRSTCSADALDEEGGSTLFHQAVDRWVFRGPRGMSEAAARLGNAHLLTGAAPMNGAAVAFAVLFAEQELDGKRYQGLSLSGLQKARQELALVGRDLTHLKSSVQDSDSVSRLNLDELTWAAELLDCAMELCEIRLTAGPLVPLSDVHDARKESLCERWRSLTKALPELWLQRSRTGGLKESLSRLQRVVDLLGRPCARVER